jgi:RimJ/RimL family protein N-acetyltransferase
VRPGMSAADKDEILCSSRRFHFRSPARARDDAVHELFNDEATMLPWLPMLCPMSAEAMRARRESQRRGAAQGESCFMDIISVASGELVGTAGFRAIQDGKAEFGIVVRSGWQRSGVCKESFVANARYARDALHCERVFASTLEANTRMRSFLEQAGLPLTRKVEAHGLEWLVHEAEIGSIQWDALAGNADTP